MTLNDRILNFLGLCKKAGKLEIGEESAGVAQRQGKAKLILVASDASPSTLRKAQNYAEWGGVPLLILPYDKDTLGEMLGKRVCAVLAVTDKGFSKAIQEKIKTQSDMV